MKLVKSSQQRKFVYDNQEERLIHIEEMEQDGWSCSGKVKEFTGNLYFAEQIEDENNYVYIGEFYKEMSVNEDEALVEYISDDFYQCGKCGYDEITYRAKYCSGCGKKIYFS